MISEQYTLNDPIRYAWRERVMNSTNYIKLDNSVKDGFWKDYILDGPFKAEVNKYRKYAVLNAYKEITLSDLNTTDDNILLNDIRKDYRVYSSFELINYFLESTILNDSISWWELREEILNKNIIK
jgi:hypothetical protein